MKKSLLLLSSTVLLMSNLFGTVYSDGTNPEDWKLYTTTQGEVGENNGAIEFKGNGKQGFYLPLNVKSKSSDSYKLSWKMKSKRYSQTLIQIMTKDGIRYLSYYPAKNTHGKSGRFLKFGLDKTLTNGRSRDGQWHTFTKDIKSDLKEYEPNNELVEIKAMLVRGTILIDDVEVNNNRFKPVDNIKVTNITSHSATIKFQDHSLRESFFYIIEQGTEGGSLGDSKYIPALEGSEKTATVLVNDLKPNTTYRAAIWTTVDFVNENGNNSRSGAKSKIFKFTTLDGDTFFDFKKFDELLKAEDDGEWGTMSKTTIEKTGNPRIKVRHIDYFMDEPPYRAIYTLSRDNRHLVTIDPSPTEMYSGYGSVKVSKDNRKLIISDGWNHYQYLYKEIDITNLPDVREITHSKSKLFDIVGEIAKKLSHKWHLDDPRHTMIYTSMYEVEKNGSLSTNIIGFSRVASNSSSITFYMMNKGGDKAEKILQTKMIGSSYTVNIGGQMEDRATITNDSILTIKTDKASQTYNISKCLNGATEGCAELIN